MLKTKFALIIIVCFSSQAKAADEQGRYMRGGGVGGVKCTVFDSDMTKAQVSGGIDSVIGSQYIQSYSNYILGFQTGYNYSHSTRFDIFDNIGGASVDIPKILFWIQDWCRNNPSEVFGSGLISFSETQ